MRNHLVATAEKLRQEHQVDDNLEMDGRKRAIRASKTARKAQISLPQGNTWRFLEELHPGVHFCSCPRCRTANPGPADPEMALATAERDMLRV